MDIWPNFFIVGAEKAGTSSLYEYLRKIPQIYMSPDKEPQYFSKIILEECDSEKTNQNKKNYLNLFANATNEKILGEASPGYLPSPGAAQRIFSVSPHAKILISLRDPVERIYSQYLMSKRQGRITLSFPEIIKKLLSENKESLSKSELRLNSGFYTDNILKYLQLFGKDNVKIIIFEEWTKDIKKTVREITEFLGLKISLDDFSWEVYNSYGISRGAISTLIMKSTKLKSTANKFLPSSTKKLLKEKFVIKKVPKPKMPQEESKILVDFYKEDVKKLENLIGRKLPWPNFYSNN